MLPGTSMRNFPTTVWSSCIVLFCFLFYSSQNSVFWSYLGKQHPRPPPLLLVWLCHTLVKKLDLFVILHSILGSPDILLYPFLANHLHTAKFIFVMHFMGFDKRRVSYICHLRSTENSSITPKLPACAPFYSATVLSPNSSDCWSAFPPYTFSRMSLVQSSCHSTKYIYDSPMELLLSIVSSSLLPNSIQLHGYMAVIYLFASWKMVICF